MIVTLYWEGHITVAGYIHINNTLAAYPASGCVAMLGVWVISRQKRITSCGRGLLSLSSAGANQPIPQKASVLPGWRERAASKRAWVNTYIEQECAALSAICQTSYKTQTYRSVDLLDMGTEHTLHCIGRKTVKSLPLVREECMNTTTAQPHSGADALC